MCVRVCACARVRVCACARVRVCVCRCMCVVCVLCAYIHTFVQAYEGLRMACMYQCDVY